MSFFLFAVEFQFLKVEEEILALHRDGLFFVQDIALDFDEFFFYH